MTSPDLRVSSWWMDPAFGRGYPEDGLRLFGSDMPPVPANDLDLIAQPLDCVGFNLYDAKVVKAGADGQPEVVPWGPGAPRTAFNWPITPGAHYYGPRFAYERYQKPVMITENGLSCRDHVHVTGEVPDDDRVDFIQSHLSELGRASAAGTPILGYFHWSLLDNFEWNHGYRERFGLVHVDYETMTRTKKRSFFYYRDLIAAHQTRASGEAPG
jgi:beta-glucosidase